MATDRYPVRSAGSRNAQRMALVSSWRRSRSSASQPTSSALKRRCLLPDQTTERQCSIRRGALDRPCSMQLYPARNSPIWEPSRWLDPYPRQARLGQANRRVRRAIGTVALLGSGNLGAALLDPFTRHRTRACRGTLQGFPDTVRAISAKNRRAGPAPGAPSPGAPSPTDPPPERPFPGRRPARSRCRARAGSGSTRPPHR